MAKLTRVGDVGHGQCFVGHDDVPAGSPKEYTVTYITGAKTVFTNNVPQTIVGSIGTCDCGHTTTAITGSSTVFVEGQPIHRFGDVGVINEGDGEHLVITASSEVGN
jgi:uncharacterized Zn-binding protein involved in type VI secretion